MKPWADEAPTEKELEVARILCELPKLVLEAESRRLPDFLRWGGRRRRSALDDDSSFLDLPPPPPPSISPPPPSISPPSDGNDERKDGERDGGGATSSPATPLSFPASGSEEPDGRPPRPPFFPPAKAFKTTKQHVEWVKEQSQLIAAFLEQKALLQRSIAEFDAMYQKLKARNSGLQDLQSKVVRESIEEERRRQWQRQQQDGSSRLILLGPTTVKSPHNQRWEIQPPPVDGIAGAGTPSPSVVATGRWPEKIAALDLNATPQEEEERERSSACKAAMSAQAKKRRLENNNNNYSSSQFSMAQN